MTNNTTIKAFLGTFEKLNGEKRTMKFAKLSDLPEGFIESKTKGGAIKKLTEGKELVWDLEQDGFRVFNWNTSQDVETFHTTLAQ